MNSNEEYSAALQELEKLVLPLTAEVRAEAFRFLLARRFGESTPVSGPNIASQIAKKNPLDGRTLAAQELLRKCKGGNLSDMAVLLGYCMEHYQSKTMFSSTDLKDAFESAREPAPKNVSDVVAKLEHAGKLMRADKVAGVQNYRLTGSAVESVEQRIALAEESPK